MGVIKHANHISSYPKLVLPQLLQNEIAKQPPQKLPTKPFNLALIIEPKFKFTQEDIIIMTKLENENRKKDIQLYLEKRGYFKFKKEKEELELFEKGQDLIREINADKTKTFNLEEFKKTGISIGLDLNLPVKPKYPHKPEKFQIDTTYTKDASSISFKGILFLSAVICTIIFLFIEKNNGREWFLLMYAVFVFLYSFGVESVFEEDFWVSKFQKTIKYNKEYIDMREKDGQVGFENRLANYTNVLLPNYENDTKNYQNKIEQQIKELNEKFPLIARQIWLQAMVTNSNVVSQGNSSNTGVTLHKLVTRLALLYPNNLKVGMKFMNFQSEINLIFNNKIWINIEVDEPYNRDTRQETHFIGSNDEKRDSIFTDNNWFVLRFSESQVSYALSECVAIVQELVQFTQNGNTQQLVNLTQLSKGIETLCWTKEEARMMAMNEE